jgi:hypothetical protein
MGRVKDLVIELQNEFGFDMEFLPEDFNMCEYLSKKSGEIKPLSTSDINRDTLQFAVKVPYTEDLFCQQVKSDINVK